MDSDSAPAAWTTMPGLGAGDGRICGVGRRDILGAGRLERDRERVRAVIGGNERVVGRQAGLDVAAGEVDGAGVAGGDVAVRIRGGDSDAERATGGDGRRGAERKLAGRSRGCRRVEEQAIR